MGWFYLAWGMMNSGSDTPANRDAIIQFIKDSSGVTRKRVVILHATGEGRTDGIFFRYLTFVRPPGCPESDDARLQHVREVLLDDIIHSRVPRVDFDSFHLNRADTARGAIMQVFNDEDENTLPTNASISAATPSRTPGVPLASKTLVILPPKKARKGIR